MLANPTKSGAEYISDINPGILLLCFLAGVAPIQFLINFADSQMTNIYKGWRRRGVAGNRHITQITGIDSITAERLSEEGISSIQQLALINLREIQLTTKFPLEHISDWRDQAILYLLTADIAVPPPIIVERKKSKKNKKSLYDYLGEKLSIRTMSSLLKTWNDIKTNANPMKEELSFYKSLGLVSNDIDNWDRYRILFNNVVSTGKSLYEHFELEEKSESSTPSQPSELPVDSRTVNSI